MEYMPTVIWMLLFWFLCSVDAYISIYFERRGWIPKKSENELITSSIVEFIIWVFVGILLYP